MRISPVRILLALTAVLTGLALFLPGARADDDRGIKGGRINGLKVISDKVDDVTTVENILKSFCKPKMSDAERARALWTAAVKYRHQTPPCSEELAGDWETHDPVKLFNVYGYCMCCCSSSLIETLNRLDGREARGRILNGHSVPEVKYGGGWHMFDASLITYFPKPGNGEVASVDEIGSAVKEWYARNPQFKGNGARLGDLMRKDGWTGWKASGPRLLASCPYYKLGFFPAGTHGWNDTMVEYLRKSEIYEYGYQVGHKALFSLRPGESFIRQAGNRGLHLNMDREPRWDMLKAKAPKGDLVYLKDFFPAYTGGVVGNGYHRYIPDLPSGGLAAGADLHENLTASSRGLQVKVAGKPGIAIVPMSSPYVYLGGRLKIQARCKPGAGKVTVSISTNNARTFRSLWSAGQEESSRATVSLNDKIRRRYSYWLKIEILADAPGDAVLEAFSAENDIQHAPRTLPWLGEGTNTITVAADAAPAAATRSIACRITSDPRFSRNESSTSLGLKLENLNVNDGSCWWKGGVGVMTVPVETPGDMTALRFCTQIRARGAKDAVRVALSFNGGKTYAEAARLAGPTPGRTDTFHISRLPAGTRKALVRYELSGNNTIGIFNFRIDADYKDPLAAPAFRPFHVVHRWKENGQEKSYRARVARLPFSYTINAAAAPEMVSVTFEMTAK
jgi:hypothetical protein